MKTGRSKVQTQLPATPHVALLIETSRAYGRETLRGVHRYLSMHGPWSVFVQRRSLESAPPAWLKTWKGDGILTRSNNKSMIDAVRQTGIPAVELRPTFLNDSFPVVRTDDKAAGRMVAQDLIEKGLRSFACYTTESRHHPHFNDRCNTFVSTLKDAGFPCDIHRSLDQQEQSLEWESQQQRLAEWLINLPKPVGILAVTDQMGFCVLEACQQAGLMVPENVAVVGVENDELLCQISTPPLSSVRPNAELVGYEAARLLSQLMNGTALPSETCIAPLGIATRQSSDIVAIEDQDLAAAVRFIREHACDGISVDDVLGAVKISRSSLERRMRQTLSRSPNAEIVRVQLEAARLLLADSNLSVENVAYEAGFHHTQYFGKRFKAAYGQTPGEYRLSVRGLTK